MVDLLLERLKNGEVVELIPLNLKDVSMDFKVILHNSTRINADLIQATLFGDDKPYMHKNYSFHELEVSLKASIINNITMETDFCDNLVFSLADKKDKTDDVIMKRNDIIQEFICKNEKKLIILDESGYSQHIENIFDRFMEGLIPIEEVGSQISALTI